MVGILEALWFILPSYVANSSPLLVKRIPWLHKSNRPIDGGKKFSDGRRILGYGKTVNGFLFGVLAGTLVGVVQLRPVGGFMLALGTLVGDSVGSFIKRRFDVKEGSRTPLIDDLSFVFFAMLFVSLVKPVDLVTALIVVGMTPIIHLLTNVFAKIIGLKEVPW